MPGVRTGINILPTVHKFQEEKEAKSLIILRTRYRKRALGPQKIYRLKSGCAGPVLPTAEGNRAQLTVQIHTAPGSLLLQLQRNGAPRPAGLTFPSAQPRSPEAAVSLRGPRAGPGVGVCAGAHGPRSWERSLRRRPRPTLLRAESAPTPTAHAPGSGVCADAHGPRSWGAESAQAPTAHAPESGVCADAHGPRS